MQYRAVPNAQDQNHRPVAESDASSISGTEVASEQDHRIADFAAANDVTIEDYPTSVEAFLRSIVPGSE